MLFTIYYIHSAMSGGIGNTSEVINLSLYLGQRIRVKFQGGREAEGVLRGFDKLDNLVLDDAVEYIRGRWPWQ